VLLAWCEVPGPIWPIQLGVAAWTDLYSADIRDRVPGDPPPRRR